MRNALTFCTELTTSVRMSVKEKKKKLGIFLFFLFSREMLKLVMNYITAALSMSDVCVCGGGGEPLMIF